MDTQITAGPGRTIMTAFFATVLIGGTNFVAVKFSNAELSPLFGAGVRFGAAALVLLAIARIARMQLPRGRALAGAAIYGVLSFGLAYALMYVALLGLSVGMLSAILASVPLLTLILAVLHRQEHFTLRGVAGGLVVVSGIAVLSFRTLGGEVSPLALLAAIGGAFAAAEATVLVKGFPKAHPITTNAVGMAVGSAGLLLASAIFRESWIVPGRAATWAALGWLVLMGSVTLFALFLLVVKRWTASATVYSVTLMPVVAVALGALLLREPVTIEIVAGGALVVFGVYVGALSGLRQTARRLSLAPRPVEDKVPA